MSGDRSPALVVRSPGDVALEERDAPVPGPGEVLIRPDVVGLCGTDLDIVAGQVDPAYTRYPLVLGHEWSGTVSSGTVSSGTVSSGTVSSGTVAPGPAGLAPGTRVVAEGIVPCGHCARCRAGETNLCATYDTTRHDDEQVANVDVPVNIDTGHAAKTLMDYVFIAPAPGDKSGEKQTQTIPASNYLLDKMPDPVE